MTGSLNCSSLATRTDFNEYASTLLKVTGGSLERLSVCKVEVCNALWGYSNGDISGIGLMVGYVLEHALGFVLGLLVLLTASRHTKKLGRIAEDCLASFHACALFFAFSVLIAAIVVLVREDYGISANAMGDDTVRITQAVAMLVLLPLPYALILLAPSKTVRSSHTRPGHLYHDPKSRATDVDSKTASQHFTLFVLCWALAFYPFYSKMNAAFGPSKIAKHKGSPHSVITEQQFDIIQKICFGPARPLTVTENNLMTAFVMLAYIPLSILVIGRIVWLGIEKRHPDVHARLQRVGDSVSSRMTKALRLFGLCALPVLAVALLWSVFRVRQLQQQITVSSGSQDDDSSWTFGQVVAVTVFTPVLVAGWNSFRTEEDAF